eukprot:TRINITY_DN17005_c0_g1_i1.p1 TRINITY_DN17005_c0_g1~~TRINITY_DN17005_c0_g1_i1.p1  ORF type:complete len:407 (-),score=107.25 TRINITY_DN17005_c0_g1_i1:98-1318(-)
MGGCCSGRSVRGDECLVVWHRDGTCTLVEGPTRFSPSWHDTVENSTLYACNEAQYLTIVYTDGHTERRRGPCAMWFDPSQHVRVDRSEALQLDADEMIVTFSKAQEDGTVTPQIIQGPVMHIPQVDEWMHTFRWHGSESESSERKVPGKLEFNKLRKIPDQTYFTVPEVRTSDDALLELRFMVFFQLENVQLMLDRTHDPIADFMNSLTADIIAFVSTLTYEMFLEKTEMLNNLDAYPQLVNRAKGIGYTITKVAYRGYVCPNLQNMHDDAIKKRTLLRLDAETEELTQQLTDMKLTKDAERQGKKHELQRTEVQHSNMLSHVEHEEKLKQVDRDRELEMATEKAANDEQITYLTKLKGLGVDLTQYLASLSQDPSKVVQISADAGALANVHVHAPDVLSTSKKHN